MDSFEAETYYADKKQRLGQKPNLVLLEGWIPVTERLPEKKPDWHHSERCFVYYPRQAVENGLPEDWGVAYYHYHPPFNKPAEWIDFRNMPRQPTHWMPIPAVKP